MPPRELRVSTSVLFITMLYNDCYSSYRMSDTVVKLVRVVVEAKTTIGAWNIWVKFKEKDIPKFLVLIIFVKIR